jgi:hypothetical protein
VDVEAGASDPGDASLDALERELAKARLAEQTTRRRLARLQESHETLLDAVDRQKRQIATLKERLAAARAAYSGLGSRRAVRVAVRASAVARRSGSVVARIRGTVGGAPSGPLRPGETSHALRAPRSAEVAMARALVESLPSAPPFPPLSITALVVATTEAATTRLCTTLAGIGTPNLTVRTVGPEDSLADAAARVTTDALLLVSADVEPLEPAWLARLAAALTETGAAAVGSRLIHARRTGPRSGPRSEPADLTIRHEGVVFTMEGGRPVPVLAGAGTAPGLRSAPSRRFVPALDSCLLVRADSLREAGGLHPEQRLDVTDPDVTLRLRAVGGEIVCVDDAIAWHHGPTPGPPTREVRERLGVDWGPRLVREVLQDRLLGRRRWSAEPATFDVLASGPAPGAGDPGDGGAGLATAVARSLAAHGWSERRVAVGRPDSAEAGERGSTGDVDVVVILDPEMDVASLPRHCIRVACIPGSADSWLGCPWLDDVDVVLVANEEAATAILLHTTRTAWLVPPAEGAPSRDPEDGVERNWGLAVVERVRDWVGARRFAVVMGADTWEKAPTWGDSYFARALQRQLERRGHPTVVAVTNDAAEPYVMRADAVVHIFGVRAPATRTSQLNVLWVISHPHRITHRLCDGYDLIFSASDVFGADLAERLGRPVHRLHQATDEERFRPDPTGPHHEVLFVGNSRQVRRAVLDDLAGTSVDLSVYGGGWTPDLLDPRYLKGTWIPNEELGRYYAGADVVLADHWPDMRDEGFIANRVYDAAAAGAFVVADDVVGIDEEFDGGVATFGSRDELIAVVERYLADPGARRAAAAQARGAVLARHTFGHRAEALLAEVRPLLDARPSSIEPPGHRSHAG